MRTYTVDGSRVNDVEDFYTELGCWVAALVAAGYQVFAINPMSVARYRERKRNADLAA